MIEVRLMSAKLTRVNSEEKSLLSTTRGSLHLSSLKYPESIQNSVVNTQRNHHDDTSSFRIMNDSRQPITTSRVFTPEPTARSSTNPRRRPRLNSSNLDSGNSEHTAPNNPLRLSRGNSRVSDSPHAKAAKKKTSAKDPAEQLREREKNLDEMIEKFNIDPDKIHLPGLSIDEKENLLTKLLHRQLNDQFAHHLQHQQRREEEREAYLKEFQRTSSERDMLFKKLHLDIKHKALQTKILEKVVDSEYLKEHKEARLARIKKREAKLNIEEHKLQHEENQFKEMKLKVMNLDKAVSFYDLRDKERFDVWCDDTVTDKILEKVSKLAETHAIDFAEPPKRNPVSSLAKKLQGKARSDVSTEGTGVLGSVYRDPEQAMWDHYLQENFPILQKDEKTGALRHVCYHPKEFGEGYQRYIQRNIEKMKYQKERAASAQTHMKKAVNKLITTNILKRLMSNPGPEKKQRRRHKTAITLRKEQEPEVLKEVNSINRQMNHTYRPVYNLVEWNSMHEQVFLENRRSSLESMPIGSFGAANAITTAGFYSNNEVVRAERERIDNKALESKKSFYFLNSNPFNSKKIQQELDTIRNEELEKIEFEVANKIIEKYKNDQDVVFKERRKYLESLRKSRLTQNKEKAHSEERQAKLEEARKEHKMFSSQIRALLQRRVEGQITKADDKFANSHVIADCRDSYSKLSNLRKIVSMTALKMRINEVNSKPYNPDEYRPVTVAKSTNRLDRYQPKYQGKLRRSYSGGPRARIGSEVNRFKHADDEQRDMAAAKIQAIVRGMIARKRYMEYKDLKAWLEKRFCQPRAEPSEPNKVEPKDDEEIIEKSVERFGRLAKRPSLIINTINLVKRGSDNSYLLNSPTKSPSKDRPKSLFSNDSSPLKSSTILKDSPALKDSPGLKDTNRPQVIIVKSQFAQPHQRTDSDDSNSP